MGRLVAGRKATSLRHFYLGNEFLVVNAAGGTGEEAVDGEFVDEHVGRRGVRSVVVPREIRASGKLGTLSEYEEFKF